MWRGEIERERVGSRRDVAPRPLGDAQQQNDLVAHSGRRGVEHRHDLEHGQGRLHVACRKEWILWEPLAEIHAIGVGSSSSSSCAATG